jgi:hypothetical protein
MFGKHSSQRILYPSTLLFTLRRPTQNSWMRTPSSSTLCLHPPSRWTTPRPVIKESVHLATTSMTSSRILPQTRGSESNRWGRWRSGLLDKWRRLIWEGQASVTMTTIRRGSSGFSLLRLSITRLRINKSRFG